MSTRLPQRMSDAPFGPDARSFDGSTVRPPEPPAAAEYINVASSSKAIAAAANGSATRVEILVLLRTFPGGAEPVWFEFRLRDVGAGAALGRAGRIFLLLVGRQQQHDHRAIRVFQD